LGQSGIKKIRYSFLNVASSRITEDEIQRQKASSFSTPRASHDWKRREELQQREVRGLDLYSFAAARAREFTVVHGV
jgi:hypothetical protein